MAYGTLRITILGTPTIEHLLEIPSVVIGRSESSEIVVDSVTVSRRHARLTIDSGRVFIEDLNSDGGTFVDGIRLAPDTPRRLNPGQPFLLGDVEASFKPEATEAGRPLDAPTARPLALALTLSRAPEPVAPGAQTFVTVGVVNRSPVVDEFVFGVSGLPQEWVRIPRPRITLMPEARDELVIAVAPPKSSASAAGRHQFSITAISASTTAEARVLTEIDILPFEQLILQLQPRRATRAFRLDLANQGNAPMRVVLRASDDEEALAFGFEAAELILEPGDSRTLAVEASLRDQTVSNERRVRGFSIEAHGDAGGVRLAEVAGELLPPPIETARTASGKAPAERVGRRYGWRQVFIPIYVVGMIASLLLALVDTANWEGWAMLLGAWTVGLPLAALAWRTTSPLKIGGKLVTRVGCLGFVLVASLLGGLVAWALLNELTGRNG